MIIQFLFWLAIGITLYTYCGYLFLLWLLCILKRKDKSPTEINPNRLPEVTIVIAAHNEEKYITPKYQNTLSLEYPPNKLFQVWVNDGSNDRTLELINALQGVKVVSNPVRLGKAASINKAMEHVPTPIVVFTDANTFLSPNSLTELVKHFDNHAVGCVAGRKKIIWENYDGLASKGEGIYWKYESFLKTVESCTGSTLSGTGELYAIRTDLFKPLPENTILDDFEVSASVINQGYRVKYENKAVASETGSLTVEDEKKRKVRIAAGCFQSLGWHMGLLNPFKNVEVAFKFFSHKILRWVFVPPAIVALPLLNAFILIRWYSPIYLLSFIALCLFYGLILAGYNLRNHKQISTFITFPYYGFMMNATMLKGLARYLMGKQSHIWEKANRKADL